MLFRPLELSNHTRECSGTTVSKFVTLGLCKLAVSTSFLCPPWALRIQREELFVQGCLEEAMPGRLRLGTSWKVDKLRFERCHDAGIRVMVMIDNENTLEAICREIGVFGEKEKIRSAAA
eukprot:TRINITY_DN3010_c0_g2_i2.p3 TRINITY_DN3010_c0_g2~~TRINITY_DN3010_c0_g2_i2.p3  ORF type:complete len:120 (-),score=9.93 TRINITY_DN3010_c0_g2_i2:80-439(-)